MALAMWATQPSHACVMVEEPRRHLILSRQLDHEHLQRDAWKIRDRARRYASRLPASPSIESEIASCEQTLAGHLAVAHTVPLEEVRAAMAATRKDSYTVATRR